MKWFGRLFCLIVAASGFAAAHLLAQEGNAAVPVPTVSLTVPTLPVPTVTTPTLPVPSVPTPTVSVPVPVPSVPTPTVPLPPPTTTTLPPVRLPPAVPRPPVTTRPAPTPAPARPTTSTTITVPAQPPAGGNATPPSTGYTPAPSSSSGSSGAQSPSASSSGRPASTARPQTKTFEAKTHRSRNRVSVRLAFVLPKADRVFLIVRGPAPSCKVAGYIPLRGHKGLNTIFFAGRVHGRRLAPGVYLVSLSTTRRLDPAAATEYVRVVSPRRSVPLPERAQRAHLQRRRRRVHVRRDRADGACAGAAEDVEAASHRKPRRHGGWRPDGRRERRRRLGPARCGRARRSHEPAPTSIRSSRSRC